MPGAVPDGSVHCTEPVQVKLPALVTEPKVWFALSVSVSTSGLVRAAFATVAVSV